jgi:signal transduction histidine kinase/CheY-like chemotaxis protein/HPt (histidine-containing phosphotransfer) domain-containing protein
MRAFSFRSVQQKLVAGILLTSGVALLVALAGMFLYDQHTLRERSSSDLATQAELIGNATVAALQFDDPVVANQNLSFLRARPSVRVAALYSPRGAVFALYTRAGVQGAIVPELPGPEGTTISGDRIAVFHRIVSNKEIAGTVYLEADLGMYQRIASYGAIAAAVLLAALAVSLAFSAWLRAGITGPITRVAAVAHEVVEKRDYAVRAKRTTDDEIGTLVDAFNEMLSEIERRTAALEASNAEVVRLNKDLERRVSERTAQLEETNRQLQAANAAKSNFLSMMSHEIRTPMNGVLGMLELLTLSGLDGHQRTTLEIVRESGRSLLRIIDDILDFSKIEAGKLDVSPEPASIAKSVSNVVAIYSGNASSKGLVLASRLDPRISPALLFDPLRLQQVLNNLVNNAIKFTSKGSVEVTAELVRHEGGEDVVRLAVRDTGIGIPPEAQALLFQPFTQAGGDISRNFGGTGLGLSISQRLAELMGGTIAMQSAPGAGTTMTVTLGLKVADPALLPALAPPDPVEEGSLAAARRAPTVAEAERQGTLVLVADDHPINRLVLKRQVAAAGYAAIDVENGREALRMHGEHRFGLVITDCNMPEMDGYELARSIRHLEESAGAGAHIPIIACTANALRGEAENCFAAGMDDYIAKPVELAQLRAKLERWLPLAPAAPQAEAIDPQVLAEIAGGDAALARELLDQFMRVNQEDARAFSEAFDARDIAGITHAAHRMKGAARTVGAEAFAAICDRLEAAGRAGDWESIYALVPPFGVQLARLESLTSAASVA